MDTEQRENTTPQTQATEPQRVPCISCAELIMPEAKKCRFCNESQIVSVSSAPSPEPVVTSSNSSKSNTDQTSKLSKQRLALGMYVYRGKLSLVGEGVWVPRQRGNAANTKRSVIEIGGHQLRNIWVSEYIGSYLNSFQGHDNVELIVADSGTKQWVIAVKHNDKVIKEIDQLVFSTVASLAFCVVFYLGVPFLINNCIRLNAYSKFSGKS